MSIEVHSATAADVETLVSFNHAMAAESEDRPLDLDRLRAGIRHVLAEPRDGLYLVAREGDERVGALLVTYEWSDWRNGRFWWIQSVYVRPTHRRRGVYSMLHGHVRAAARADARCCGLRLYVELDNAGAMATYRRLGMVETDYRLYEEDFTAPARSD
jgi:ribosomal protein S18 acetylase RimI-like enzyme